MRLPDMKKTYGLTAGGEGPPACYRDVYKRQMVMSWAIATVIWCGLCSNRSKASIPARVRAPSAGTEKLALHCASILLTGW